MSLQAWILFLLAPAAGASDEDPLPPADELLALRVGRAETVANGPIEHAVVLIGDGSIRMVGRDLPIERGIPTLDLEHLVVTPGFVSCYSSIGSDSERGSVSTPQAKVSTELYPRDDVWEELLELGVTTIAVHPNGEGMPGQAVAVRPRGETPEEMTVADSVYLKIDLRSNASSKDALRDGFEEADEHEEEVAEEREDWEKKREREKKKDDEDEEEDEEGEEFVPPVPDEDVVPFLQLREGTLRALFSIRKASDWIHLLDALGDEEIEWSLHAPLGDDVDLHHVVEEIGSQGRRVVCDPEITFLPHTRRDQNLPAMLADAGAKVAFCPRSDSVSGHEEWRFDVGRVVAEGFDRELALRAMTLEPAAVIGLDERLGSIEAGKDANLLFFDGDPLEPSTRLVAVMLEGELVSGEVSQ